MPLPTSVDVIIVGGGPTGLSAAASLLTCGVKDIVIVDGREESTVQYSRALVMHPRTLEVTEAIECSDRFVAAGEPIHGMRLNSSASGLLLKNNMSFLPSKYNYVLSIPQSETERILLERVKELGGNVVWNHKAIGFKEERDGVKVVTFDGGDTVQARYVIGADGTHSLVRQAAGIAYADPFSKHPTGEDSASSEKRFCLADVTFDRLSPSLPEHWVSPILHPDGAAVFIPLPKQLYRIVCQIRDSDVPKAPPVEYFQKLFDERFPSKGMMKITEMKWSSRFFIKYRMAEKYFVPHLPGSDGVSGPKGGVAIIGDAGHVHSPMGGQGMNLGMRDAIFLGQAIAADMGSPDVSQPELNKWAEERRAAGERVIQLAGDLTNFGTSKVPGWLRTILRDYMIWIFGLIPYFKRRISWNISGLGERPA